LLITFCTSMYKALTQFPPSCPLALCFPFQVNFPSGFRWGPGGGLLPGLSGGAEDCDSSMSGQLCWSVQLAWRNDGLGEIIAWLPVDAQGADFWTLPSISETRADGSIAVASGTFAFVPEGWTDVEIAVVMNAVGAADGELRVTIGGAVIALSSAVAYRLTPDLGVDSLLLAGRHRRSVPVVEPQYLLIGGGELYAGMDPPSPPPPLPEVEEAPAPAPEEFTTAPAPGPEVETYAPAPGPEDGIYAPAPAPEDDTNAPAPAPEEEPDVSLPPTGLSCTLQPGIDFFGGDLVPNSWWSSTFPEDCCAMCQADPACYAWTFVPRDKRCYPKGASGWRSQPNPATVSGVVMRDPNPPSR
jgi:hypothetical protein